MILPIDVLGNIARSNLFDIIAIHEQYYPSTLPIYSRIRGMFGLSTQAEAVTVYDLARKFADTEFGQDIIQCGYLGNCSGIPISEGAVSIFGTENQYRLQILVHIGDVPCIDWVEFAEFPDQSTLQDAILAVAAGCAQRAPRYRQAMDITGLENVYGEIVQIVRLR